MPWAPDYVTLAELKSFLEIADTDDDAELAPAITAASRAVDTETHRQFGVTIAELRLYPARWDRRRCRWIVEIDDLMNDAGAAPQLQVAGTAVGDITAYVLEPVNAAAMGRPRTQLVVRPSSTTVPTGAQDELVAMTRPWGWTATPVPVKQATLLQASRIFSRRTSPYGVAGSPELGSELRLLAKLDPDVKVTLRPFVRWWAAA